MIGAVIGFSIATMIITNEKPKQERSFCIKQTTHDVTCYWEYG